MINGHFPDTCPTCPNTTTNNNPPQPIDDAERLRLVKALAYEFVRFNHDTRKTYLVTNVTDDCMLELEGMAGQFSPDLFQRVNDVPEHMATAAVEPAPQPDVTGVPELLPCPFCGPGQSCVDLYFDDTAYRYRVRCGRCGCSTGTSPRNSTPTPAITAWNTRATQPATTPSNLIAKHLPNHKHVTVNPGIYGGSPIVSGIRFTVANVLSYIVIGRTVEEIARDHNLSVGAVRCAVGFAQDVYDDVVHTTPPSITERARRATDRIINRLPDKLARQMNKRLLTDIIAAEFGEGEKS